MIQNHRTRKEWLQKATLLCVHSMIALLIAEGTLYGLERLQRNHLRKEHYLDLFKKLYRVSPNQDVSFEHQPNVNLRFQSNKGECFTMQVITNSEGLREDRDIPFQKPERVKRIIGLGDSNTFGASVDNDKTFLKVMEPYLSNSQWKVQTLNFGIGFSNPRLEYEYLKHKQADRYSPDMVLLGLSLNDIDTRYAAFDPKLGNWYYPAERQPHPEPVLTQLKKLLLKLRLVRSLNHIRHQLLDPKIETQKPDVLAGEREKSELSHWLKKMKAHTENHNTDFLVIFFPDRAQMEYAMRTNDTRFTFQSVMKQICDSLKIPFYDLLPDAVDYVKNRDIPLDEFYWSDGHPWISGHRVIGELTASWIQTNRWLEQ